MARVHTQITHTHTTHRAWRLGVDGGYLREVKEWQRMARAGGVGRGQGKEGPGRARQRVDIGRRRVALGSRLG